MDEKELLIWAMTKLAKVRANFGNAPFTTNDMDKIIGVIGSKAFHEASIPNKTGEGVWGGE